METKRFLILVAGGTGTRVGGDIPKQYLEVAGKPILFHTLEHFTAHIADLDIVIVMAPYWQERWKIMAQKAGWTQTIQLADAGENRFQSVKNGLAKITSDGVVAVHDAVRPILSKACLDACFATAEHTGAAIPVTDMRESLRMIVANSSQAVDRSRFVAVQTPQVFSSKILREAYEQDYNTQFTDDASVVEKWGHEIALVEGDRNNRKITYPEDLEWLTEHLGKDQLGNAIR